MDMDIGEESKQCRYVQTAYHIADTGNSIAGEKFSVSKLQLNLYN